MASVLPRRSPWRSARTTEADGAAVEVFIAAAGSVPGEVLAHGAVAHDLDVARAIEPGRDGPADRVGERLGVQVGEDEAGPLGGLLVVVRDGVDEAARGA